MGKKNKYKKGQEQAEPAKQPQPQEQNPAAASTTTTSTTEKPTTSKAEQKPSTSQPPVSSQWRQQPVAQGWGQQGGRSTQPQQQQAGRSTQPQQQQQAGRSTQPQQQQAGRSTQPQQQQAGRSTQPQQQQAGRSTQPQQQQQQIRTQAWGQQQQQPQDWRQPTQSGGSSSQQQERASTTQGQPQQQQQSGRSTQPLQQQQTRTQAWGQQQQQPQDWRQPTQSGGSSSQQQERVSHPSQQQERGRPSGDYRGASSQQQRPTTHPQQQREQGRLSGDYRGASSNQGRSQQPTGGYQAQRQTGGRQQIKEGSPVSCTGIKRGTLGDKGQVAVNYLDLDLSKMPPVAYHYDVTITPDKPKKFMRQVMEQFRLKFLKGLCLAFDGKKSFYTVDKIQNSTMSEEVEIIDGNGRAMSFHVDIKPTDNMEVDLSSLKSYYTERVFDKPMRALQCLEVVLSAPCHEMAVRAGRSFFKKPENGFDLGDGYEAWTGLYQAAILGDQPFLNIDISHKSFPKAIDLIQYLEQYVIQRRMDERSGLDHYQVRTMSSFIKGISILYAPPASFGAAPRGFKVNGLSDKPASTLKFKLDSGAEMSIAEYFLSRGYKLKFPNLQCLHVGSTIKAIYVPMELCKIQEGQALNKKDGEQQVRKMIRFAATSTNTRKEKIMQLLNYFNHNAFPTIQRFGVNIGSNFIVVPTRLLPAPTIEYLNNQTIRPSNGSWQMRDKISFLVTKPNLHKWAIIYNRMNFNEVSELGRFVSRQAKILKVSLEPEPYIVAVDTLDKIFGELKGKYELVFVILPGRGAYSYADVKQKAELNYGLLTQCIKQSTVQRLNPQLISNILLKVNSKLNGTNHKIQDATHVPLDNVMYLGADVTHPSPDQKHIPSVVGVSASHDRLGACYNMQYRLQNSKVENIEEMESIVTEHLRVYYEYQKRYPKHIIYYRDGVSDGQFPIVKNNEIRGINNACTKLKFKPNIVCVIVVKRHHARFFPDGQPTDRNKYNNVAPGTVVDRVIVHPNEVQFFMVSHQSIQGTAKPTRYNVIENTDNMDIDVLQKLTYNLCHMFPRCNRAVSYPAPAYLAHLAAFRGRVYLEGTHRFVDPKSEYKKRLINPKFLKSNPMYFV